MSIFIGSGVAVCTPFDNKGLFNEDVYEKLILFHGEKGTDAIISCGTTGESATLGEDEHVQVVKTAVNAAKKAGEKFSRKIPVIAGAGGNDTEKCVKYGKALINAGADALMYVTPYYNKTSQKGLIAHYTKIAGALDIPIMVYNVPGRTGLNINAKTLAELSKIENITAVKEAGTDFYQIAEIFERCEGRLDVYSGDDQCILPILSLGGKGVVSTVANIAPAAVHNITTKFFAGDIKASRELQLGLLQLIRLMFADVNPMPVKAALNILGFDAGACRMPLVSIDDDLRDNIKQEMTRYGLI